MALDTLASACRRTLDGDSGSLMDTPTAHAHAAAAAGFGWLIIGLVVKR